MMIRGHVIKFRIIAEAKNVGDESALDWEHLP